MLFSSDSPDHQGDYKIDDIYENTKYPSHENSSNCEGGLLKKLTSKFQKKKYEPCGCSGDDEKNSNYKYTTFSSENELKRYKKKNYKKGKKNRNYNLSSSPG